MAASHILNSWSEKRENWSTGNLRGCIIIMLDDQYNIFWSVHEACRVQHNHRRQNFGAGEPELMSLISFITMQGRTSLFSLFLDNTTTWGNASSLGARWWPGGSELHRVPIVRHIAAVLFCRNCASCAFLCHSKGQTESGTGKEIPIWVGARLKLQPTPLLRPCPVPGEVSLVQVPYALVNGGQPPSIKPVFRCKN